MKKKQTKMEQRRQAAHNRRHNSAHATTTTAQPAIKAARREATQKRNSPPHNHLHDAKKIFKKDLPCNALLHLFLPRPARPEQQPANSWRHKEKLGFVYVHGAS